ncbi:hypothetical protein OH77DRAFT_996056 [Trametes cingulata]|nr:hypothetical protein OH77DRAFT_996056 [Trametes cingulata]
MASGVLAHPPWHALFRVRLRWDGLVKSGNWTRKHFLSTPPLATETPAMRQVMAHPYPEQAPDATLFEEAGEEYHEGAAGTEEFTALKHMDAAVNSPSLLLKELVKAGKYEDATRVLGELVDMGVEIVPHPVYHFAACDALLNQNLSQDERVEAFAQWWSYFPPRTEVKDAPRSLKSVLALLSRNDPAPDIPLIIRFALLAASKGYAPLIAQEIITTVARYATAEVSLGFLEDFCATALDYEKSLAKGHRPSRRKGRLFPGSIPFWYGQAINELALSGRSSSALALLRRARSHGMRIGWFAYDALCRQLRLESKSDKVTAVMHMWRMQQRGEEEFESLAGEASPSPELTQRHDPAERGASVQTDSPNLSRPSSESGHSGFSSSVRLEATPSPEEKTQRYHPAERDASVHTDSPDLSRPSFRSGHCGFSSWVGLTRFLKRSLAAGETCMSAEELSLYITGCLSTRRTTLVNRLRARAYRHERLIEHWAFAELLRYRTTGRSLSTIMEVFRYHFHLVGVPHIELDIRLDCTPLRPMIRRKLPPTAKHTLFMWGVFLEKARLRDEVDWLYIQFLKAVAASRELPVSSTSFISVHTGYQSVAREDHSRCIPPPSLFDARHFALFMHAFDRIVSPRVTSRVVLDMYSLGVAPNDEVFMAFVSSLRYLPTHCPPTGMLDYFEAHLQKHDRSHEEADSGWPKAQALVFIYSGVMLRLLSDNRRADAVDVGRRFRAKVSYLTGSTEAADAALHQLATTHALRTF